MCGCLNSHRFEVMVLVGCRAKNKNNSMILRLLCSATDAVVLLVQITCCTVEACRRAKPSTCYGCGGVTAARLPSWLAASFAAAHRSQPKACRCCEARGQAKTNQLQPVQAPPFSRCCPPLSRCSRYLATQLVDATLLVSAIWELSLGSLLPV